MEQQNGNDRDILDDYYDLDDRHRSDLFKQFVEILYDGNDDTLRRFLWMMLNDQDIRRQLLFYAMDKSSLNMLKFVLHGGMNLDFLYVPKKTTPLLYLINDGEKYDKLVRLLLREGASPNFYSGNESPLSKLISQTTNPYYDLRSEESSINMVKLLMDYGADPNIPDNRGTTALEKLENKREYLSEDLYNKLLDILTVDHIKEPEFY